MTISWTISSSSIQSQRCLFIRWVKEPRMNNWLTIQPCSNGLSGLVDQHTCIIIKFHYTSIGSLQLLNRPNHNSVSNIPSPDLVRRWSRNARTWTWFRAEIPLFLDNYYYSVAFIQVSAIRWLSFRFITDQSLRVSSFSSPSHIQLPQLQSYRCN